MSTKASTPELKKYMDKRLFINLQGNRKVSGVLRGFDIFLNLVLDEAKEETPGSGAEKKNIGTVVVRGNSITSIETLEAMR
ncbi:like-Sm ribonucleoprotein [Atractiella rhizophila]|nr:like-Sm ribonucleoprotein [Atractiella rhizophila]